MDILCTIMVYVTMNNELSGQYMDVKGKYMEQTPSGNAYQVDFKEGFEELRLVKYTNVEVQWVKHNDCLFLK